MEGGIAGWSLTAGGRGISLPTQAYPPATFPKALMVLLKTYLTLPSRTLCSREDNLPGRRNGAVC